MRYVLCSERKTSGTRLKMAAWRGASVNSAVLRHHPSIESGGTGPNRHRDGGRRCARCLRKMEKTPRGRQRRKTAANHEESSIETYSRQQQPWSSGPHNATLTATTVLFHGGEEMGGVRRQRHFRPQADRSNGSKFIRAEHRDRERAHARVYERVLYVAAQFRVEISVPSAASVRVLAFKRATLPPSQRAVRSCPPRPKLPDDLFQRA
ncbi:hypothetical protein MRX96_004914 [Rhipicephalus microplus]